MSTDDPVAELAELAGEAERRHLRALARGSAATIGGAALSTVAGFGLVLVVTRHVDTDAAGRFFALTTLFVIVLAVAGLGADTGLARFALRTGGVPALRRLLLVAGCPVLVVAVLLTVAVSIAVPGAAAVMWVLPLAVAADLSLAAVRARASFRSTVLIDKTLRPCLQWGLVALALAAGWTIPGVSAAWASAYVVGALLAAASLRALVRAEPSAARAAAGAGDLGVLDDLDGERPRAAPTPRQFWSFTWPRAIARIAQIAIQKVDILVVAWLLSPTDAAIYVVATRFVVFGQLANQAVSSVTQPRFTMLLLEREAGARDLVPRVFAVSTCWSVLLAWPVYLCVAASPSAYLGWFGPAYVADEAVMVAVVMAVGMLLAVASGPVDTLLLMVGRSGKSLANTLLALVVDVALLLVLVPPWGIVGAAVAWVVALAVRCALAAWQLHGEIGLVPDLPMVGRAMAVPIVCVGLPVGALTLLAAPTPGGWLATCLVVALGYAAAVWRLRRSLAVDVFVAGLARRRTGQRVGVVA